MSKPIAEGGAWRQFGAAILKRAVLDAKNNTTGHGFEARNWLLSNPLAAYLCDELGLSRGCVLRWTLSLDPLPLECIPSALSESESERADGEPLADSWTFEELAEHAQVDGDHIAQMVELGQLEVIRQDGHLYVAQTPEACRFLYQRWRISMGLDDAAERSN